MADGTVRSPHGNERLKIGDWMIEPTINQISAGGKILKLEPKTMALLRYLAERPGEVVSREALLSALWPGVVVGDDSLTQAVIKLRKALGDVAESPAYIQTIPKGGYRLVAKVAKPEPTPAETYAVPPVRVLNARRRWLAMAAVIAAAFTGILAWWIADRGDDVERLTATVPANVEALHEAQPSVSIRAFDALGGDAEAEVLARGITADLVTDLTKISGVSVVAESAAGTKARYVVSGSLQRVRESLRLNVHLTDATTGKQLWSERYDRTLTDLFAVQEELGRKVLQMLPAKVSEAELARVAQRHTRNLEAYEYFQRGQMAATGRQRVGNEAGREMYKRAIELDPTFARAYASLAVTYVIEQRNLWGADGAAALQRAYELAVTARQINPDVPETYLVLGLVELHRRRHREALQQVETAIRLYPSYADAYALMGGIAVYVGQPQQALGVLRTAMRLNPDGTYLYFLILGRAYYSLADLDQAKLNLGHALSRNPADIEARIYMAATLFESGDKAAAAWESDEIRTLQPGFSSRAWLAAHPLTDVKVQAKLLQALNALRL